MHLGWGLAAARLSHAAPTHWAWAMSASAMGWHWAEAAAASCPASGPELDVCTCGRTPRSGVQVRSSKAPSRKATPSPCESPLDPGQPLPWQDLITLGPPGPPRGQVGSPWLAELTPITGGGRPAPALARPHPPQQTYLRQGHCSCDITAFT